MQTYTEGGDKASCQWKGHRITSRVVSRLPLLIQLLWWPGVQEQQSLSIGHDYVRQQGMAEQRPNTSNLCYPQRVKEQVSPLPWSFVFVTAFKKAGDTFKMGKYHPEFKVITLWRANGGNEKMPPSTFEWLVLQEEPVHDPGMGTWSSLHLQKHLENFIASFSLKDDDDRRSSVE